MVSPRSTRKPSGASAAASASSTLSAVSSNRITLVLAFLAVSIRVSSPRTMPCATTRTSGREPVDNRAVRLVQSA